MQARTLIPSRSRSCITSRRVGPGVVRFYRADDVIEQRLPGELVPRFLKPIRPGALIGTTAKPNLSHGVPWVLLRAMNDALSHRFFER